MKYLDSDNLFDIREYTEPINRLRQRKCLLKKHVIYK